MNKNEKSNNSANNGNPTSITGNGATIYMSGCGEDFYHGKNPKQIDIIKSQRAVIERLQIQIDKMQEQARMDGERFSEVLRIKNKLMDLLLEDRKLLQKKLEDIE